MKVFWSWQSDTTGKTGRHFVRALLDLAVKELKEAPELDEPTRDELHVDQDRQDVPGSPRLADTIMEKIRAVVVVVADVTPVGEAWKRAGEPRPKKLMNPNVAVEMGYALHALPGKEKSLLMVLNEFYGSRTDLPFDLGQYAGPITYRLAPDATKNEIESARLQLAAKFKLYLAAILSASSHAAPAVPAPIVNRRVDTEYPIVSRLQHRLEAEGYRVSWVSESRVASLEFDGWEIVTEPDQRGVLTQFHVVTSPENMVLVKNKEPDLQALADLPFYRQQPGVESIEVRGKTLVATFRSVANAVPYLFLMSQGHQRPVEWKQMPGRLDRLVGTITDEGRRALQLPRRP
jgi:hypothetical protein